jgi:RNA polymerase sigma factor (sigma-70 family)
VRQKQETLNTKFRQYEISSAYPSAAFWQAIEAVTLPLEVLVHCLRMVHALGDTAGRDRILSVIIRRLQAMNEYWAYTVLGQVPVSADERFSLVCDLCADLYEKLILALLDPQRIFWEENFMHCLYFERKHVYRALLQREGFWYDKSVKQGERIPRALVASLDCILRNHHQRSDALEVEDDRAQMMLQQVEYSDLVECVLRLPEKCKTVVLLLFWEGRSEKDAAWILGVSDRTVRNRLHKALQLLYARLSGQKERACG